MRPLLAVLVLVVAAPTPALAQRGGAAPAAPAVPTLTGAPSTLTQRIRFQRRTPEDGLPQINVTSVAQDANGFIWMGTQDGLVRFDGSRFKVYRNDPTDPDSIASSFVVSLATDKTGNLWIGTGGSGLDRLDAKSQKFQHHRAADKTLGDDTVLAVRYLSDGGLWIGTNGGGITRLDPVSGQAVIYSTKQGLSSATVRDVARTKDGKVWVATSSGLDVFEPKAQQFTSLTASASAPAALRGTSVTTVAVDRDQIVWLGTEAEGLFRYDPAKDAFTAFNRDNAALNDNGVTTLLVDSGGHLWVGTETALHRYSAGQRFVRYLPDSSDPRSLPTPPVTALFEDATQNVWVGTLLGGVGWFNPLVLEFGYYKTPVASGITEDKAGNLWLGTPEQLCKYRRGDDLVGFCYTTGWGWMLALVSDSHNSLWMATVKQGVYRLDETTDAIHHYAASEAEGSLRNDAVFSLIEDRAKRIWVGMFGGGLARWNRDTDTFVRYTVPSEYIYVIREDPTIDGVLWIGTADAGLIRLDTKAGTFTKFANDPKRPTSLSYNSVASIYFESPEVMWVGTYGGGVDRFDIAKGEFRTITTQDGLPADSVLALVSDGKGRLWVGTTLGLATVDEKTFAVTQYSLDDGLGSIAFGQAQAYRLKDGKLVFGGSDGFNIFKPEAIQPDSKSPEAKITRIQVLGEEVKTDVPAWALPELKLGYKDSLATIDFSTPYYAAPNRVRYAYTLEGLYNKWISLESPTVSFTNLEGGDYVFRLRSENRHGVWNETAATLHVHKDRPPWRRPWAYAIYAALVLALVALGVRYQRQRVQQVEKEGRLAIVEYDLALTGAIQTGFLPERNEIVSNRVHVYGFYQPADACSGDWWWHQRLSETRHLLLVGDVTGHGPGPAMVTAAVAAAFRVLIKTGLDDVRQSLEVLNHEVLTVAKGRYHMTMAALELDESTGRWLLHSAGAPPMLSIDQTGRHKVHFCAGSPLGSEGPFELGVIEGTLARDDRILLYTDGIPEITQANGTVLGMRRFAQLCERTRAQSLAAAATSIVTYANEIQGGRPQLDDWTFTIIEWRG